jgi:hypothetical protein
MVEIPAMGGNVVVDGQRSRKRFAALLGLGSLVLGASLVVGQVPAVADPSGFFIAGRQLFSIDLATGASAAIGSTGVDERFSALAFGPDGTLFAVADAQLSDDVENRLTEPSELYTIDTRTGQATLVGALSEDGDDLALILSSLTFSDDGTALLTGLRPNDFETVFAVDVEGASGGRVPVSRLTTDSGFATFATDTACDGTVFGASVAIPERDRGDDDTPTTATVGDFPPPGSFDPSGVFGDAVVPPVGAGRTQQPLQPATPLVLTTIDPDTGATSEVGEIGLNLTLSNHPGLAVDRGDDALWSVVLAGGVFAVDAASGTGELPATNSANQAGTPLSPQNLAISPVSCSQPTTTTTTTSTTTTSTTVVTADEPDPPPAPPATPVPAEPNFTG